MGWYRGAIDEIQGKIHVDEEVDKDVYKCVYKDVDKDIQTPLKVGFQKLADTEQDIIWLHRYHISLDLYDVFIGFFDQ